MPAPLHLGYVPLTGSAPLIVAKEKGFFTEEGLDVRLERENAWATIRDKIAFAALDAAQMLAPLPLAMRFAEPAQGEPPLAPLVLDLNGNAITVGRDLFDLVARADPESLARRPIRARGLREAIRRSGRRLTFGVVFPFSSHHYQLRWWLEEAGIDPDRDLDLVVVPPPRMAQSLADGTIDGCCVGEPWNQVAVRAGVGRVLITGYELWQNGAEKVLGVSRRFAEERPEALQALLRACLRAGRWLDRAENRLEAARLMSEGGYVDAPSEVLGMTLLGFVADGIDEPRHLPDTHVFSRYAANFPWLSHAFVYARAMKRAGQIERVPSLAELAEVYRPDLLRPAAAAVGLPLPSVDLKTEGLSETTWRMERDGPALGPDRFLDRSVYRFDAEAARADSTAAQRTA